MRDIVAGAMGLDLVGQLERRDFLKRAMKLGVALPAAGGVLAACTGEGKPEGNGTPDDEGALPRVGGRLKVAMPGAGRRESYDPALGGETGIGNTRLGSVFDALTKVTPEAGVLAPALAEEWEPNPDATVWTFHLRRDVVWHDGKPFTADDVLYSIRSMSDPKHSSSIGVKDVLLDDMRKLDDHTVEVPLARPDTLFVWNLSLIVQDGSTDFTHPIGTGMFMYESFTPGERSLSVRNPNYWDEGKPYAQELEIISIDDQNARVNALLSGEINVMPTVPFALIEQIAAAGFTVVQAPSTSPYLFYMAVDEPPFDDVRVRQAMRLIADRPALIEGALSGYGTVSNDLFGQGLPYYADQIPQRERDLDEAMSLLQQAGRSDLQVTLETSPVDVGLVEAATLFKTHAAEAGVTIDIERVDSAVYYDASQKYTRMPFAQSVWVGNNLASFYKNALLSDSPWNETHWRDPAFDEIVRSAMGATDEDDAARLWLQAQEIQWDEGGYIIWGVQNGADASAPEVHDLKAYSTSSLGGAAALLDMWVS